LLPGSAARRAESESEFELELATGRWPAVGIFSPQGPLTCSKRIPLPDWVLGRCPHRPAGVACMCSINSTPAPPAAGSSSRRSVRTPAGVYPRHTNALSTGRGTPVQAALPAFLSPSASPRFAIGASPVRSPDGPAPSHSALRETKALTRRCTLCSKKV
jgi:hypothetical protein